MLIPAARKKTSLHEDRVSLWLIMRPVSYGNEMGEKKKKDGLKRSWREHNVASKIICILEVVYEIGIKERATLKSAHEYITIF